MENYLEMKCNEAKMEGRQEAWEAAKKIVVPKGLGGFSWIELKEIFNIKPGGLDIHDTHRILMVFSANDAIEKISYYENNYKEIKVGDEVYGEGINICDHFKGVVIEKPNITSGRLKILDYRGYTAEHDIKICTKSGKHFDTIEELFCTLANEMQIRNDFMKKYFNCDLNKVVE